MNSGLCEQTTFTYEDLETDIERLVSMKAGMYTIPGFDRDDVGQEIRMTCVKALTKYDAAKNNSTPFHYLARCVDNRMRNLLRDNAATLTKAQKDDKRAIARVEKKKRLQFTLGIGHDVDEAQLGESPEAIYVYEFKEAVESKLPDNVKPSLVLLIQRGPPSIPKAHLKVIKQVIREVFPGWGT
jgi:DNA-directed RNA polymerase specialized sigma24 family protein